MVVVFVFLIVLGLALGSFVNALVWRLHEQASAKKANKSLSILRGRSMCPDCRHQLAAKDLVPVFSWLSLKGKCRYCHKSIPWQYPLVELATAGLFAASYAFWPLSLEGSEMIRFGCWLVFVTGFMALAVYDLKWMTLPHKIVYPLIGLAVAQWVVIWAAGDGGLFVVGVGLSALVGGGIFYALFQISKGQWIGGGDVKLGFLLGLVVGDPLEAWLMLFLAAALGSLVSIPLLISGKATRKTRIPFGPFLLAAGFITVLFGRSISAWLDRLLLLS